MKETEPGNRCHRPTRITRHEPPIVQCSRLAQRHGLLKDIGIVGFVRRGRIGARDIEDVAQLGKEELVVGALGRAGGLPARDEGLNGCCVVVSHVSRLSRASTTITG